MGMKGMELLGGAGKWFCSLSLFYLSYLDGQDEESVKCSARSQPNPQQIYSIQSFIIILFPTMKCA